MQDRVGLSKRLHATLTNYYPQVLEWFTEKDTLMFCDFVARWSSLKQVRTARRVTLITFFNQHNARYLAVNEARITKIRTARALTDDAGVIEPNRLMTEVLIAQLKLIIHSIERLDAEIKTR